MHGELINADDKKVLPVCLGSKWKHNNKLVGKAHPRGTETLVTRIHTEPCSSVVDIEIRKGHSRATANFIAYWKDKASGIWCGHSHIETIANAHCQKDNAIIIKQTFGEILDDDLKYITLQAGIMLLQNREIKLDKLKVSNIATDVWRTIFVNIFMAGNFLSYTIALGNEVSAPQHYPYCKLCRNDW